MINVNKLLLSLMLIMLPILLLAQQDRMTVSKKIQNIFDPALDTTQLKTYYGISASRIEKTTLKKNVNMEITNLKVSGNYTTYTYTFGDLLLFSYTENTEVAVKKSNGEIFWSGILNKNEFKALSPGEGIFGLESSNPFSLLTGDPITGDVLGYFAMNEQGKGVGTNFLTYMPNDAAENEKFIVFSYDNNNQVVVRDLTTNEIIWNGILHEGEHFASSEIQGQFLLVSGSEDLAVLSYNDQGYLLPAETGLWAGEKFLGFAGFVGEWSNDLNIISFENNNNIVVKNTESNEIIWEGFLSEGEEHSITLTSDQINEIYFEVESDKFISCSVAPFNYYKDGYYHLLDCVDKTGQRIGNLFYTTAINGGRIDFSSFEDYNSVEITNLYTNEVEWSGNLGAGDHINHPTVNAIYKVEGTGKLVGSESYGGRAGGAFVPVYYGLDLPDLSITANSISFLPTNPNQNETVNISCLITNNSINEIFNVEVQFFDGDPNQGGVQIGYTRTISSIEGDGGAESASLNWITPEGPAYHLIYIIVDPENKIIESNESNNRANKPLIPNEDLQPPLAVTISAPSGLTLDNEGEYNPNPFEIAAYIINNGDGEAINVSATLELPNGLILEGGETSQHQLGNLSVTSSMRTSWLVRATGSLYGYGNLLYSINVQADNAEEKNVKRTIIVPEPPFEADVWASWLGEKVSDADIYVDRGNGFEKVGTTQNKGSVHVTNLSVGTKLKAVKKIHDEDAVKDGHEKVDDRMFEIWVDNDIMKEDGTYNSSVIPFKNNDITLIMKHPIFKYNLVLSAEWSLDEDQVYYDRLEEGLKEASKLLFDATDGQVMFNKIAVYDDEVNSENADIILHQGIKGNFCDEIGGIDKKWELLWLLRSRLHMHYRHSYSGNDWPNENDWIHSLVHEFGHYAFGVYDEYLNGDGKYSSWLDNDKVHPNNYGLMEDHENVTEESSANDYLKSYSSPSKSQITEQYDEREMSCWNWIKKKLEKYYSDVTITLPPAGYFPDGYIYDRPGPDDNSILDQTTVIDLRSEEGNLAKSTSNLVAFNTVLSVTNNGYPIPAAHVYFEFKNRIKYLGKTDLNGRLDWAGAVVDSKIIVNKIINKQMINLEFLVSDMQSEYKIELKNSLKNKLSKESAANGIGVILNGSANLEGDNVQISLNLLFDKSLAQNPSAKLYYGDSSEQLTFSSNSTHFYSASTVLDGNVNNFNGSGYLELTLTDENNLVTNIISEFSLYAISNSETNVLFNRGYNFNIEEEYINDSQLGISFTTFSNPYLEANQSLYPITEMFSIKFENDNSFAQNGSINIYYTEEEVVGFNESSIALYEWNEVSKKWNLLDDNTVDLNQNVAASLTNKTGVYCLFATEISTDVTPPSKIIDLGSNTGKGQSNIVLSWSNSGDDGVIGTPSNLIIKYNSVPITNLNWDLSYDVSNEPSPAESGSTQSMIVTVPNSNSLYYLAMKVQDEAGNISDISNFTSSISSVENYTFSLVEPIFNDTLMTSNPTFIWEAPENISIESYTLWYGEDELFNSKNIIEKIDTNMYKLDEANLSEGTVYFWKVIALDDSGIEIECNQTYSRFLTYSEVTPSPSTPSTVGSLSEKSIYFYPNPLNPQSETGTIRYSISKDSEVTIKIYDISNTLVLTLLDKIEKLSGNELAETWDGKDQSGKIVSNGVYFYIIESSAGERAVGKIAVLK